VLLFARLVTPFFLFTEFERTRILKKQSEQIRRQST
jgi:hypothetical protein